MNSPIRLLFTSAAMFLLGTLWFTCSSPDQMYGRQTASLISELSPAAERSADPDVSGSFEELERAWKGYWYSGLAEITSFELEQVRYGRTYPGHAVQIFVTEDFSKSGLHKLNWPVGNPDDAVSILKLNFTRDFNTGIYPYKTMQSVFTPAELKGDEQSLKVTTSVQEWCGQMFSQLNARPSGGFDAEIFSYFDREGEMDLSLEQSVLEDDIWTRIRINPQTLPVGDFEAIPSNLAIRLNHLAMKAYAANGELEEGADGQSIYRLQFPDLNRTLQITFRSSFPFEITGWTESFPSGFGQGAEILTTTARRKESMQLDYWSRNRPEDKDLREQLGLP